MLAEFERWIDEVDKYMVIKHGVGIDDIPDMDYYSWFNSDMTVKETVDEAISIVNEGGF